MDNFTEQSAPISSSEPINGSAEAKFFEYCGEFTLDDILAEIETKLIELSQPHIVNGIVHGHIKALASFDGGYVSGSITEANNVNFKYSQNAKTKKETVDKYSLKIEIILLSESPPSAH